VLNVGDTPALVGSGRRDRRPVITGADFPWTDAVVHRRPGLEAVEDLLRAQLAALDPGAGVPAAHRRDTAWWRWQDEPFDA
jgi:hypothetical protein